MVVADRFSVPRAAAALNQVQAAVAAWPEIAREAAWGLTRWLMRRLHRPPRLHEISGLAQRGRNQRTGAGCPRNTRNTRNPNSLPCIPCVP